MKRAWPDPMMPGIRGCGWLIVVVGLSWGMHEASAANGNTARSNGKELLKLMRRVNRPGFSAEKKNLRSASRLVSRNRIKLEGDIRSRPWKPSIGDILSGSVKNKYPVVLQHKDVAFVINAKGKLTLARSFGGDDWAIQTPRQVRERKVGWAHDLDRMPEITPESLNAAIERFAADPSGEKLHYIHATLWN